MKKIVKNDITQRKNSSMELVKTFMSLFHGRTDVWGSVEGMANKEPITEEHYKKHLEGKTSLGIYPLQNDGKIRFFALDLDEKDFAKAKILRDELYALGLSVYIAQSKSKGFHVYGFLAEPVQAIIIRKILFNVLQKTGIKVEIFPKQDRLDAVTPYGNYINLPLFGSTRPFLSVARLRPDGPLGSRVVPVDKAIRLIKVNTPEQVLAAASTATAKAISRPEEGTSGRKRRGRKRKHPPCIEAIIKGVKAGARDEAAFAIARHYLDQQYLPDEVMALLAEWDKRNDPPLNDPKLLETKVKSAEKGYAFGCNSIKSSPLLAEYCPGGDCQWLEDISEQRKKEGLIQETSFHETDTHFYEEIVRDGKAQFLGFEKASGNIAYMDSVQVGERTYVPYYGAEVTEGAILFPTGVEEYGTTEQLVEDLKKYILKYDDLPGDMMEFSAWYIVVTWVFDRLSTISYLRFLGDTGVGKSRSVDIIGRLCYKPMIISGAVTAAPIYRLIKRFRGTLVLDEADFRDDESISEVIIILNCGFERGRPVIRCSKDDPDNLQVLPCFGPKVFATRFDFKDLALEARCQTIKMQETDRDDIPPLLGKKCRGLEDHLRNRLLLWRLRNLPKINQEDIEELDLGDIEPRLKQTNLPLAIPFKDMPGTMARFKEFVAKRQVDLLTTRSEAKQGRLVYALFSLVKDKEIPTAHGIAGICNEEFHMDTNADKVGRVIRSLGITNHQVRIANKNVREIIWDPVLMKKLYRRYIVDKEEFTELFPNSSQPDMEI